jgi:SLT domain-containing protein
MGLMRWSENKVLSPVDRGEPHAFGAGTRQARVEALLDEAARASGLRRALDLVDEVIYDTQAGSPSFWVTPQGRRIVTIGPTTLDRKTRAGQLIAATHELIHAEHFNAILASMKDLQAARSAFFVHSSTRRYAIREVMTEEEARSRVANHLLGRIPLQQAADSTKYINFWRRRAGIE